MRTQEQTNVPHTPALFAESNKQEDNNLDRLLGHFSIVMKQLDQIDEQSLTYERRQEILGVLKELQFLKTRSDFKKADCDITFS